MPASPSRNFDQIAEQYDATRGGEERGRLAAESLAPWLLDGTVLEIGVGTGLIAGALREQGRSVVGLDLSPKMLSRAVPRVGRGRLAVADALRLPVADAAVSTVVVVFALHAIGEIGTAIAEMARVLRPGGRIVSAHGGISDEPTDISAALAPVLALPSRPDRVEDVVAAGSWAGLVQEHHGPGEMGRGSETPRVVIEHLRARMWSWLWDLDEDRWRTHVEPAIANLEALPDPDRPREYARRFALTVLRRPA